jgi:riboflavin synthase
MVQGPGLASWFDKIIESYNIFEIASITSSGLESMFTGIIEGLGTIVGIGSAGQGKRFVIESDSHLDGTKIGDSIAVNGACLTAVVIQGKRFEVDVAPETLSKTTFPKTVVGERVNLERALRLSDRLDGHLVSGHIDGKGTIKQKKPLGNAVIVSIGVPESLTRYMIPKGSVAIDGISLTINEVHKDGFEVSIIPHTAGITTIGFKKPGAIVNIETDMIGKYVERFISQKPDQNKENKPAKDSVIDMKFLHQSGFIR